MTKVAQTATLAAGLRYQGGDWTPVASLNNSFTWEPPRLSLSAEFKGYIDPPLSLLLYGVAGPFAAITPFVKLEADPFATPWWKLYGGLDATVGVKVAVLGHSLGDHTETVIGFKKLLAQADSPPATLGMVVVPAGTFLMGCDPAHSANDRCYAEELPLHLVFLDAYQIDRTEVTNGQYAQCVAATHCTPPSSNASATRPAYFDNPMYANYPVVNVSWYQALAYCRRAGKRLPTDEVEKGCSRQPGYPALSMGRLCAHLHAREFW